MKEFFKTLMTSTLFLLSASVYSDTVVIATNNWTPYNTSEGEGLVDQVVKEAFALVGHDVDYVIQPWLRAYESVKQGRADMTYPWSFTEDRAAEITFNESPLIVNRSIFYHQADKPFSWNSFDDLKQYSIGAMIGHIDTTLLEKNGVQVIPVKEELQNLRKLIAGRIDAFAMNDVVGNQLINENLSESEKTKVASYPDKALVETNMHGVFSPNERGEQLAIDFETGLNQLKESGRYAEILYR